MRTFKLLFILLVSAVVVRGQGVKFEIERPHAGDKIKFSYYPKGTKLQGLSEIKCLAYVFHSTPFYQHVQVDLVKDGDGYKGELNTRDSVTLVGLAFFVGEQMDETKNGYLLEFTHADGKIPAETYLNKAFLFTRNGTSLLGLTVDAGKAAGYYKQALDIKPVLKQQYNYDYLELAYKADVVSGTKLINENITAILKTTNGNEQDLILTFKLYSLLKDKVKADAFKAFLLKKYPLGDFAYTTETNAIPRNIPAEEVEADFKRIIAKFNLDLEKKENINRLNSMVVYLTYLYGKTKNSERFDFYGTKMKNKVGAASFYNGYGAFWAEKNDHIDSAVRISKKSLQMIAEAKNGGLPVNFASKEEYVRSLDHTYGTYSHTYAKLLYLQGRYKEALESKEKALQLAPSLEEEISYVSYLMKDGQNEKAFGIAEKIMKSGKATPALKADFKHLYMILKKEGSYESYVDNLGQMAFNKERDEWLKNMINIPAPDFSLVNLKGETVSLAKLKGKVVVLDYWATWCAPCLAAFPGMQKAVNKYKDNPNVVFLFINTSQREEERMKVVKDYMGSTNYTFNVLLDENSRQNLDQFKVRDLYKVSGIPAKFIIDGKGNIRFKIVGSSDSAEEILKELDLLINLASN